VETGNKLSASSLIKQDLHLLPDNQRDLVSPGQTCFVNIARNGIQTLRRDANFKVNEFSSFKFPHSLDDVRWTDYVKSTIESEKFKALTESSNTIFLIEDSKALLMPQALHSKESAKTNFEFLFGVSANTELVSTDIQSLGAVAIYSVPVSLSKLIKTPIQCGFVNWLSLIANTSGTSVKCHISETQFALVITDGENLLFSNWFTYQKADDVLYFFMATLETQKILHSKIELTLSGEVNKGDEIHSSLTKFISKISFANRPKNLDYSYSIKSSSEHQFPFIFASACV
jgi:hypothetical protein